MADYLKLSCPSCGGKLKITPDIDRFACSHCGNEHVVNRGVGIVSIAPVIEGLQDVRAGVDKTASELAIFRLKQEIDELNNQYITLDQEMQALNSVSTLFFNKKRKAEIIYAIDEIKRQGKLRLLEIEKHKKIIDS